MKKFAWLFATLSLCASAWTACSDDDSKDLLDNGKSCSASDECKSGICTTADGGAKICAEKVNYGDDCDTSNKKCADGLQCDSTLHKCYVAPDGICSAERLCISSMGCMLSTGECVEKD